MVFTIARPGSTVQAAAGRKFVPLFDPPSIVHRASNAHAAAAMARRSGSGSVESIPFWASEFSSGGQLYPYQMVGTDPAAGSATTTVKTVIVPIIVNFSDGTSFDGTSKVAPTAASPIWHDAYYNSGHTQYVDALQNAEFWTWTRHERYHVRLDEPSVQAPVTFNVPAGSGQVLSGAGFPTIGVVDINWWYPQVLSVLSARHLSAKVLPIFLTYNVLLYQGDPNSGCCIIGYHDAVGSTAASGKTVINTYAWASWTDPGIFSVPIDDVNALSHEVAEWANDPFTDNVVPSWSVPSQPQYGCSNILEVGDPLVGVTSYIVGYHMQDEAFFSWFARQTPSISINGQYSFFGTFDAPSPSC